MEEITIGRAPDNNIILKSQIISGYHATITIDDQGIITYADHSRNGTLVNGQPLHNQSCIINPSDEIMLSGRISLNLDFLNKPQQNQYSSDFIPEPTNDYVPISETENPPFEPVNEMPNQYSPIQSQQPQFNEQKNQYAQNNNQTNCNENYRYNNSTPVATPSTTIGEAFSKFFKGYIDFSGRARRSEYWWIVLVNFLICLIPIINLLWILGTFIPGIALSIRRLHDIGKSGWFLLLSLIPIVGGIILIVWYCQDSQTQKNLYGESPKYKSNTYSY